MSESVKKMTDAPLEIGDVFRRLEPVGDEYDVVRIVGVAHVNEVFEPVVAPIEFGAALQVDPDVFFELYTRHGVKQIKAPGPNNLLNHSYGTVAGRGRREAQEPQPAPTYDELLEAPPLDAIQKRLDALEGDDDE